MGAYEPQPNLETLIRLSDGDAAKRFVTGFNALFRNELRAQARVIPDGKAFLVVISRNFSLRRRHLAYIDGWAEAYVYMSEEKDQCETLVPLPV